MRHSIADIATYIFTPEDSALGLYNSNIAKFSSRSGLSGFPLLKTTFWMAASGFIAICISLPW